MKKILSVIMATMVFLFAAICTLNAGELIVDDLTVSNRISQANALATNVLVGKVSIGTTNAMTTNIILHVQGSVLITSNLTATALSGNATGLTAQPRGDITMGVYTNNF